MPADHSTWAATQAASARCAKCGLGLGADGCKCRRSTRHREPSRAVLEASQVAGGARKPRDKRPRDASEQSQVADGARKAHKPCTEELDNLFGSSETVWPKMTFKGLQDLVADITGNGEFPLTGEVHSMDVPEGRIPDSLETDGRILDGLDTDGLILDGLDPDGLARLFGLDSDSSNAPHNAGMPFSVLENLMFAPAASGDKSEIAALAAELQSEETMPLYHPTLSQNPLPLPLPLPFSTDGEFAHLCETLSAVGSVSVEELLATITP